MEKRDNLIEALLRELKGIGDTSPLLLSKATELENLIRKKAVTPDEGTLRIVGDIRVRLIQHHERLSKEIARLKSKN